MLEDLLSWCAPRSTSLRFWCTYLDVNCWWLMSRNFAVFFFLFEWNKPVNHCVPLDINLKFFLPNLKSKSNLLWLCGQWFRFSPCQQCYEANKSPPPTLPYKLSKFKKPHWFVCLNHHETFTSMSYRYLKAFHILYDQLTAKIFQISKKW